MKHKGLIIGGSIVAVIIIIIAIIAGSYNGLVNQKESVDSASATIQTQLQRRADLIPNLVSTVKGYAAHEEEVFSAVSDARAKLAGASTMSEQASANGELDSAVSRLLAIAESYPELKANENFVTLQDQLEGTENRIAVARNDYNDVAKTYNASIKRFPKNIIANIFGFGTVDYFEASSSAQDAPVVSFN